MGVIQKIAINNITHTIAASTIGICETATSTAAKTTAIPDLKVAAGLTISLSLTHGNSAVSPTLSVNSGTAYPIVNLGTKNANDVVLLTFSNNKWYAAGGADAKVKDVTLGGESIVDSDGVVKLEKTVMTDNYIPVWDNTAGVFKDGIAKSNIVTLDTTQTITAGKYFSDGLILSNSLRVGSSLSGASAGTSGQVLTSQGSGSTPVWSTVKTISSITVTKV